MKRALLVFLIVMTCAAATVAFTQSFTMQFGESKGPKQPINFPHNIHAGKLGIDCLYCH